jgi:predicted TIM-barrel fold metal-dependent hydrolase
MIIDSHTHIFPPFVCEDRRPFLQQEPAFRMLYSSGKARLATADMLIEEMDRSGIDRAVVFGFPWSDQDIMRRHNDYLGEAAGRFADRLLPFACVDPRVPVAIREVERCLAGGMRGVGELGFYTDILDTWVVEVLEPIAACCQSHQVPIVLHVNEPVGHRYPGKAEMSLKAIYELIRSFPQNRFILAHWGGGLFFYELLKKEARETLSRVAYDTAASPFLYIRAIYSVAVQIVGPGRILFGSDYPLIEPGRYFEEMAAAGLSEENLAWIKGRSASEWLGLESG